VTGCRPLRAGSVHEGGGRGVGGERGDGQGGAPPGRGAGAAGWIPLPYRREPNAPHLYTDRDIRKVLARHRVVIPEAWSAAGPFEALAPLPLADALLGALYEDVGLPVFHMSLLLGVGLGAVRSGLRTPEWSFGRRGNQPRGR
jgi:hypothetical protein